MGGALHIERRYVALFLYFETTTIEYWTRTNAWVTPRGVSYTLRSVLRGLNILNAHFTGDYILQTWVFLCLFSSLAVVGHEVEQADTSIHVFYV